MSSDPIADLIRAKSEFPDLPGGIPNPDRFSPGVVGVVGGDLSRYSEFNVSLIGLQHCVPRGSKLTYARSVDVSGNCNAIIRDMADHHEWVWIMGDDHSFRPEVLVRLLAHGADVVVPHCLKRVPPWLPVVYSHQNEDGWYVPADLPLKGLTEIHAAGSAGMLISRRVIEAIEDPWFRPAPDAAGLNEDLYFCQQVREAGFKIYCDPSVLLGHLAIHCVWPGVSKEGKWETHLVHAEGPDPMVLSWPSVVEPALEREKSAAPAA